MTSAARVKALWLSLASSSAISLSPGAFLAGLGLQLPAVDDETSPLPLNVWHRALQLYARVIGEESLRVLPSLVEPQCLGVWAPVLRGTRSVADALEQLAAHGGQVTTDDWQTARLGPSRWTARAPVRSKDAKTAELCRFAREAELAALPVLYGLGFGRVTSQTDGQYDEFQVRWDEPTIAPLALAGSALGVGASVVSHFMVGSVSPTAGLLLGVGAGGIAGAGITVGIKRRVSSRAQRYKILALERASSIQESRTENVVQGLDTGRVVAGRYRLGRRLGTGASSVIWAAERLTDGLPVAVKLVRAIAAGEKLAVHRLRHEAQLLERVVHPNVVRQIESGEGPDGTFYLVLEQLAGETLAQRLERQRPLPWDLLFEVGLQLCDALQAIHDAGIVHRDLKPANVQLLGEDAADCQVKLLDFGIAETAWAPRQFSEPGIVRGTPGYMAPEQQRGEPSRAPVDLYALGCVLLDCLSNPSRDARNTRRERLTFWRKRALENVPGPVRELLRRATAGKEAERPTTAHAFRTALKVLRDQLRAAQ